MYAPTVSAWRGMMMKQETRADKIIDMAKLLVFLLLITAAAFAYFMLTLLLISFVTSHYLHFSIEGICIASAVGTLGVDIWYIVKKRHSSH